MILVTGGAGYIGSHTVKELLKQKYQVVTLDNLENGYRKAVVGGEFIKCDLRDKEQLDKVFRKYPIDSVMHFAAYASVPDSVLNPAKYFDNNLTAGLNLLNAMLAAGVSEIVFSSSAAVYGESKKIPIKEDNVKCPTSSYGLSKLQFEQILYFYDKAYRIKSVSLRYFCAAGADPKQEIGESHRIETHIIPLAILTALGRRKSFQIFGTDYPTPDGTGIRDFIHVTDLANIHILALKYLDHGGETKIYNCGNKKGYSARQVLKQTKRITGTDFKIEEKSRRPGDPAILIADSSKIEKELGWKPKYSDLKTIIETAYNWHKNNPEGFRS